MGALIAFTAEYLPWVTGAGILLFLIFGSYKKREFWMIVQAFAGAIIARFVFTEIIRYFYDRQRPFEIVDGMNRSIFLQKAVGDFVLRPCFFYRFRPRRRRPPLDLGYFGRGCCGDFVCLTDESFDEKT